MTPRESWHLPPDISRFFVAGLWVAVLVTLVILLVRLAAVHRAITRDPAASDELRSMRKTLGVGTLWGTLGSVVILLVILNGVHLRQWLGAREDAVVVSKKESRGRSSVPNFIVTVATERAGETTVYATQEVYEQLDAGDRVPVITVSGVGMVTQLGREPTVSAAHLVVAMLLLMVPITNVWVLPWRTTKG